jgi:DNA replicative helicase MCM subunit Mcm2 (Cdc46/Mcm family)
VWRNRLYLIPPPSVDLTFDVWYHQRVSDLEDPEDVPITPKDLDEAILLAARIRAHRRAQEPDLAQEARAELEEMFDNMRDDEEEVMQEEPDRVRPDNTWL